MRKLVGCFLVFCFLLTPAFVGCGGSGYQTRKAAEDKSDPTKAISVAPGAGMSSLSTNPKAGKR
jgi:hypothetical protein